MAYYPATIDSYDAARRRVRIRMTGMTDGDILLPEAELVYSLGDKSHHTEIEIKSGDAVWVDFIADDPRYPIITGYRNPEQGNSIGWRKWHHGNIEIAADGTVIIKGANLILDFQNITTTGTTTNNSPITNKSPVTNQAMVSMAGGMDNGSGGAVRCNGGLSISGGDVVSDGISLKNHTHQGDSGGSTGKAR